MKITILGSGTSHGVPMIACDCDVCTSTDSRDKRLRSAILIDKNSSTILIDAGPDIRQQLLSHKLFSLDALLLTHAHKDHIAGMDDLSRFNQLTKKSFPVYASEDVLTQVKREFYYAFRENPYPGVPKFSLHALSEKGFSVAGILFQPLPVMHYKLPILGFRTDDFAYITDAKTIPDSTMQKLKGLDLLIINALRKKPHISHLSLDEALDIIEKVKPKKALLTHISHRLGKHSDVESILPENVFLAYDGMSIEL